MLRWYPRSRRIRRRSRWFDLRSLPVRFLSGLESSILCSDPGTDSMPEHPESFPVNALVPIAGTPLEKNDVRPFSLPPSSLLSHTNTNLCPDRSPSPYTPSPARSPRPGSASPRPSSVSQQAGSPSTRPNKPCVSWPARTRCLPASRCLLRLVSLFPHFLLNSFPLPSFLLLSRQRD